MRISAILLGALALVFASTPVCAQHYFRDWRTYPEIRTAVCSQFEKKNAPLCNTNPAARATRESCPQNRCDEDEPNYWEDLRTADIRSSCGPALIKCAGAYLEFTDSYGDDRGCSYKIVDNDDRTQEPFTIRLPELYDWRIQRVVLITEGHPDYARYARVHDRDVRMLRSQERKQYAFVSPCS